jgi:hypothetical protein
MDEKNFDFRMGSQVVERIKKRPRIVRHWTISYDDKPIFSGRFSKAFWLYQHILHSKENYLKRILNDLEEKNA